jgi:hypothetical protein
MSKSKKETKINKNVTCIAAFIINKKNLINKNSIVWIFVRGCGEGSRKRMGREECIGDKRGMRKRGPRFGWFQSG